VKPITDAISRRFLPKLRASHPVIGRTIAFATRYDVRTHVDSSIVAERLPAMWGSDTLTAVVSSTSMTVANMTAIATIQGLTCLCSLMSRSAVRGPRSEVRGPRSGVRHRRPGLYTRRAWPRTLPLVAVASRLLARIDRRRHRHAGTELMIRVLPRLQNNLHGDALD